MAASINNTVNKGLVSPNPFLNPGGTSTGGTTTASTAPTTGGTFLGIAQGSQAPTPVTSNVSFGGLVSTPPSSAMPAQPKTATGANNGLISPPPATQTSLVAPPSSGKAPAGMEYNGQGQLVPISNQPTFNGAINSLATTASQPNQAYNQDQGLAQSAAQALLSSGGQQSEAYKQATQSYQDTLNKYNQVVQQEAQALGIGSGAGSPIPLEFVQGRQQVLQGQYANELAGYGGVVSGAASALNAANTQQGIQQQGLTSAGGVANTAAGLATGQQGTQQSGLAAAGGLVKPELGGYANQYFNPMTQQPTSGGNYSLQSAAQNYAQMVQNGQMSYNDAVSALGGYGVAGQQALNSALPSGFNVNQSNATAQSQSSQTAQQQQYQSAAKQAQNLGLQLNQVITQAGINPNDLNALNSFVQKVATNTSDPNYQTFQNLVNDMANTYAQVLTPAGGSTTDMVRNISQSLLNASQSGSSILQVMQNLDSQVQAKISGVTTAYGTSNGSSNQTIATSGSGLYSW